MIRKFEGENFHHLLFSIDINIRNSVMSKKKSQLGVIAITTTMIIIIWPNFNQNPAKASFHDINVAG